MTDEQAEILKSIHKQQQRDNVRMQRIERVLVGDKEFGVKGLVDKVDYHGREIRKQQDKELKRGAIITGISLASAFFGSWLKDWIYK